ncbi:MAG: hypothetical protein AAF560_29925 [Acidobacteriota bacterium]
MPKILSANRSSVLIDGNAVEGLQEITYRTVKPVTDVAAIGSDERIGVVYGTTRVAGTLRVRSIVDQLETALKDKSSFQIFVALQGEVGDDTGHEITLDECYLTGKSFAMGAGGVADSIYEFSATSSEL